MGDLAKIVSAIALVAIAACAWLFVDVKQNTSHNYTVLPHSPESAVFRAFNKQTGEFITYSADSKQFNIIDFDKKINYSIDLNNN
jgi:hypothetical protein